MAENRNPARGRQQDQRQLQAARRAEERARHRQALALAAWDLARTRRKRPDSARGQVITLRAHQRLLQAFEDGRAVPENERSLLRVPDDSRGTVLCVHGISTGPAELYALAEILHDAGLTVCVMRLPDHGIEGDTITEVSWQAALEKVRERYRLLSRAGGRIHVVGLGFGAVLALHLAQRENVSSLVLLAPALMPRESFLQRAFVRWNLHRLPLVRRLLGWNTDVVEGMERARGGIGQVKVPIYAAQCDDDDRASPESLRALQRKARHEASLFRAFPSGGHAVLAAHGEATLYEEIVSFCTTR